MRMVFYLLYLCLLSGLTSLKPFYSFPIKIYPSPPSTYLTTQDTYLPLQSIYRNTTILALSLTGFTMKNGLDVKFNAVIGMHNSSYVKISAWTSAGQWSMIMYNVMYIDSGNNILWYHNYTYHCNELNLYYNADLQQIYTTTLPFNAIQTSQTSLYPYLVAYHAAEAAPNHQIVAYVEIDYFNSPNVVSFKFVRGRDTQNVSRLYFGVLVVNNTAVQEYDMLRYHQKFIITNWASSFLFLYTMGANLGIPAIYQTGPYGLRGNCALSFYFLSFREVSSSRSIDYNISATSIFDINQIIPATQLFKGGYYMQCWTSCDANKYYDSISQKCTSCPSICPQCRSSSFCQSCLNTSYYLTPTNYCLPCSFILPNCVTCQPLNIGSGYKCTLCQSPYLQTNIGCLLCQQAVENCSVCVGCGGCGSGWGCSSCLNGSYVYDGGLQHCRFCGDLFSQCRQCTLATCLLCSQGYYFNTTAMACIYDNGTITHTSTITGCYQTLLFLNSTQICQYCKTPTFDLIPSNNRCQCVEGTLVDDQCVVLDSNCVTPVTVDNKVVCLSCNVTVKLKRQPVDGECVCIDKYEIKNGLCVQICGNGYLMSNSDGYDCDDGNTIDGDGCSSLCRVQKGYRCQNGSSTHAANCFYIGTPLIISLKYIQRSEGLNQGSLVFNIYPPLPLISKMDLNQYISFECDSTYQLSSIGYDSGLLTIVADYTQDMEDRKCNISLTYDQTIIRKDPSSLQFTVQSRNQPLIIVDNLATYQTITFIFQIISYCILAMFILSSMAHKMIGVELIFTSQMVYLSYCFYQSSSVMFSSLKGLNMVTGYWAMMVTEDDRATRESFTMKISLSSHFNKNNIIVLSVLFLCCLAWGILWIIQTAKTHKNAQNGLETTSRRVVRLRSALEFIYRKLIFPLTVGFLLIFSLSGHINSLRLSHSSKESNSFLSLSSMLFVWLLMGIVAAIETLNHKTHSLWLAGEQGAAGWYIPCFIVRSFVFANIIQIGIFSSFSISLLVALGFQIGYLLLFFGKRPYKGVVHNIGLYLCQTTIFYALSLAFVENTFSLKEVNQILLILILQAFLILAILFSCIRLIKMVYQNFRVKVNQPQQIQIDVKVEVKGPQKRNEVQQEFVSRLKSHLLGKRGQRRSGPVSQNTGLCFGQPINFTKDFEAVEDDAQLMSLKERMRQKLLRHRRQFRGAKEQ